MKTTTTEKTYTHHKNMHTHVHAQTECVKNNYTLPRKRINLHHPRPINIHSVARLLVAMHFLNVSLQGCKLALILVDEVKDRDEAFVRKVDEQHVPFFFFEEGEKESL